MRTMIIIVGGLVLLVLALATARWFGDAGGRTMAGVAKIFLPVWLAVALVNMWIGVSQAGYSVAEELPIFLLIFAVPAAVAAFVWWKYA